MDDFQSFTRCKKMIVFVAGYIKKSVFLPPQKNFFTN